MTSILVGRASGTHIGYMQETADGTHPTVQIKLTVRRWDVTDPKARLDAATNELGPITEENKDNAQWWIDADRNAAALAVYRPSTFQQRMALA